jgi:epoxyqueuosine reductase QueG
MKDMKELSGTMMDLARCQGASAVGITTVDTLQGGPPSTDLTYVLPGARSAVTFAVSLDQTLIEPYLMKKDHTTLERHIFHTNSFCSGIAQDLAGYLDMK